MTVDGRAAVPRRRSPSALCSHLDGYIILIRVVSGPEATHVDVDVEPSHRVNSPVDIHVSSACRSYRTAGWSQ